MRVHDTEGFDALYVRDTKDGVIVECPCGTKVLDKSLECGAPAEPRLFCTCGKELCYRPWWSW